MSVGAQPLLKGSPGLTYVYPRRPSHYAIYLRGALAGRIWLFFWRMEENSAATMKGAVFLSIIITGSLAYDHIMHFPGHFSDHILPEKIAMLNISFLVDTMQKLRGGCAANIAYSLALLGEKPVIMGTVGTDFDDYRRWMEQNGIDPSLIKVIPNLYTASCFITTDLKNNQITGFYSGAMGEAHTLSFHDVKEKVSITTVSPNDPLAMVKYCRECRELSIPFIFDPGHQIPRLSPEDILDGFKGSCFAIMNDYELEMVIARTGKTEEELLAMTETLIVTKGAQGSVIKTGKRAIEIPVVKTDKVADPTGAGDAYRSAVIKGYLNRLDLETTGKLASLVATYVVEKHGTTEHHFTMEELRERYSRTYGESLPL